jgi:multiple sugar transport system substrate-binding protein
MQPKSWRIVKLLVFPLTFLMAALGCQRTVAPPPPPPFQGVTLRVACPPGVPEDLVTRISRGWLAAHQARIEIVRPDASDVDIHILRPADLPHHAAAGRLQPVDSGLRASSAYVWNDLLTLYREQLLVWDRIPYGVPLVGEAHVLVYRADLYDDPKVKAAYKEFAASRPEGTVRELQAPHTWQGFADQAEFFRLHHPSGKEAPSLPPLPASEEALDRLFHQVAVPHLRRGIRDDEVFNPEETDQAFAFHYDLNTGAPRLTNKGFIYSLDLLKRLGPCRSAPRSGGPEEALADGSAVLGVIESSGLVALQKSPQTRDKFAIAELPGADRIFTFAEGNEVKLRGSGNHVPYLGSGGWLAGVSSTSSHADAAWDLLANLSGPAVSSQTVSEPRWGGGIIRQEQQNRTQQWDGFDLSSTQLARFREVLRTEVVQHGLKNPVLVLRTPNQAEHRGALGVQLRACLEKGVAPAAALEEAARRWKELDAPRKVKALEDYRVSLGLLR